MHGNGNGWTNQGWSDDDEDTELCPDGEHGAQKEVDEGYTQQVQPTVNTPREAQYTPPMGYSPSNASGRSLFFSALHTGVRLETSLQQQTAQHTVVNHFDT